MIVVIFFLVYNANQKENQQNNKNQQNSFPLRYLQNKNDLHVFNIEESLYCFSSMGSTYSNSSWRVWYVCWSTCISYRECW